MMNSIKSCSALGAGAAVIILTACGGSQSATGIGPVPQRVLLALGSRRGFTRILPPTAENLYVANVATTGSTGPGFVTVYKPGTSSPMLTIKQDIYGPHSLTFDGSKKLYVANFNSTITMYAIGSNTLLHKITKRVGLESEIAFDPSNTELYDANFPYYTGSGYVGALTVYAAGGGYQETITTDIYTPEAVNVDSAGNVYVGNNDRGITGGWVTVYNPSMNTFYKITDGIYFPSALTFDGSGNLYVLNDGNLFLTVRPSVTEYAPGSTTPSRTLSVGNSPTAIACDGSGNLYVANPNPYSTGYGDNVLVFSKTGTKVMRKITSGINFPESLAVGPSGYLNVANALGANPNGGEGSITQYAPGKGKVARTIQKGVNYPVFVTFGP